MGESQNDFTIPLQENWQGGPASLGLEVDELMLDSGKRGMGVIMKIETPIAPAGGLRIELGTGEIEVPTANDGGHLHFWVAASLEQVQQLHDATGQILRDYWEVSS